MPTVDIILKEKIANLGAEGDVVKVKGGFARNFLIPQGKAYAANKGNLRQLDSLKKVRAEREAKEIEEAEKIATKLKRLKLKLTLATGQAGKAFGSITTIDIQKAVAESAAKVELDRHQIELEKPIKSTGTFEVPVKLHAQVNCFLKITVTAADGTEAEAEETEE
ncbi:50S ribosomal protein L9 [Verrucomicrobium sp. BvORR034]|jgi:large subunit ribosomal protein L9|uniref:50S ribosomal protein L9 n=1 Tax=Verrucomicrobium sp. BvORR034 TaxID=1396418 RepID=UPI000678F00B|nr:50S ribosomal protein L9 [Verrucomicrobium sp. BvORR034]